MIPVFSLLLALAGPAAAQEPDRVTMTLKDFLDLYEKSKDEPDAEKAPRDHVIASVDYVGEVVLRDGDPASAVFDATFRVENLGKTKWIRVPLLPADVAVESATINGRQAPLLLEGGNYALTTDQQGAFEVKVRFAVGVNTSRGSSGFAFVMHPAGSTSLELAVPTSDALDFSVANARLQEDEFRNGRRIVRATLPPRGSLSVAWQRKVEDAQETQQSRIYASVDTLVGIGEGVLRADVTLTETILFAGVDTLRVKVPTDMTLLDVQGAGLRDWTLADDGTLTVQLTYEAEGAYRLSLDLERVIGDAGTVSVPVVQPLGVERSKGFVGVQALGNLELAPGDVRQAASVDVRTLPAAILGTTSTPVLLGFKYLGDGAVIPLSVSEHDEVDVLVTLLDQAEATTMFTADGRRLTSVRYMVRNNRRQFLRLALPSDAELWSASVAGKAVQPAAGSDGRLLIPLVRSAAAGGSLAAFDVEVVYVEAGEAPSAAGTGRFEAELPRADAPTTYVGWTVYAPHMAKVGKLKKRDGSLRPVDWLSRPMPATEAFEVQADTPAQVRAAQGQVAHGGLGEGAQPVEVSLPLDGQPLAFEKLLALDERLWVAFDYRGLK